MKLSIIIPVYNVEQYLRECLDSVVCQNGCDYEIILVDDGSSDSSSLICDEYAKKYKQIHVYHQKNQGLAKARYEGLIRAEGRYVAIVDSDDWIEPDYLEQMVEFAEQGKYDIVISNYFINKEDVQEKKNNKPSGYDKLTLCRDVLTWKTHAGLWNKLFRRTLLTDNNILPAPADYYEDMYTYVMAVLNTDNVGYIDIYGYHYRYNPKSLTNDKEDNKRLTMFEQFLVNMCSLCQDESIKKNAALKELVVYCMNGLKTHYLKQSYSSPRIGRIFRKYMNDSFNGKRCSSFPDFAEIVAFRYGILYPYRLYKRYILIRHYIHERRMKIKEFLLK